MKAYPSISYDVQLGVKVIGFQKYDGSCIRGEWSSKRGFYKFGSRHRLLDPNEKPLGEAVGIIKAKYEDALSEIFTDERLQSAICFFEFYGPNSAFGQHVDEPHDTVLFDVNYYKQGIMPARRFVKTFGHLDIAAPLYDGTCNARLVEAVKNGTLEGLGSEGIVCKMTDTKRPDVMFKIKRQDWYDRLKAYVNGDMELYNKLL